MLPGLPVYISLFFIFITLGTLLGFIRAVRKNNSAKFTFIVTIALMAWLIIQGILSYQGFYTAIHSKPPRIVLLIGPALIVILLLFILAPGRRFMERLPSRYLTGLHAVRILVELSLYWLFLYKYIPRLMTFEGRNPDIISGISSLFILYYGFVKPRLSRKVILVWNIACLLLLLNIVVIAILSLPYPFQQFAFDQPNTAVLYFPFSWLPCFIVPVVLFSHLVMIRRSLKTQD